MEAGEQLDQSVCYRHPRRVTRLSCSDCGRPICVECSVDASVGQKCPECARPVGRGQVIDARQRLRRTDTRSAPFSFGVMGISIFLFVVGFLSADLSDQLILRLGQFNQLVSQGEWWRLLTSAFLHADLTHVLFNMWALYVFGPQLERQIGSAAFASVYLSSAVAGGAAAYLLGGPRDLVVGASGAIFGLFGVWLFSAFRSRRTPAGRNLFSQLLLLLGLNAALPLFVPRISWQGHAGGFVAGLVVAALWSRLPVAGPGGRRLRAAIGAVVGLLVLGVVQLV